MALNFPNVSVLGLSQDTRFFDAGFQFASFKRLSIAGLVQDLTIGFGITGTWSGPEGLIETIRNNQNYQPLILNGVNFGSGRIENIDFDGGLDVRTKQYQANILVYESGNLFNFIGPYYNNIDSSDFQYLQNFSENYNFEKKLNGGYEYTHDASIQFSSGVGYLNSIDAAQNLAKTLFTGSNLGFAFYSGFTNKQGKRYFSEVYNLLNNECSFSEKFGFDKNDGSYSATNSVSIQLDEEGIITATEKGNIRGIENPNYQKALSAVNTQITGAYFRCSGSTAYYFPTGAILLTNPLSLNKTIDIFANNIDYTVAFNNSIANQSSYFWNYTTNITKEEGITTVSEEGTINGRGSNSSTSFKNAQNGLNTVLSGVANRCGSRFIGIYAPSTNYLLSKQQSFSPIKGQTAYSYAYSNDPSLISNVGIKKKTLNIQNDIPVYLFNQIGVVNYGTILQFDYQSSQGSQNVSVNMEGDKSVTLNQFLQQGISDATSNKPNGFDIYVGDCSYNLDVNNNVANVSLTWLYNKNAPPSSYPS